MGLWNQPKKKWMLGIPLGGVIAFVIGVVTLGAYHGVMNYTNSNEFCYSCHVGMDTIVEEYQQSTHFKNPRGVIAATCSDCHVPREFVPKIALKIGATADIFHKLTGRITLENFETEHRPRLAQKVTQEFINDKSKQCQYCHLVERMDLESQSRTTARRHQMMEKRGQSCIDCHAGIAHRLPEEAEPQDSDESIQSE